MQHAGGGCVHGCCVRVPCCGQKAGRGLQGAHTGEQGPGFWHRADEVQCQGRGVDLRDEGAKQKPFKVQGPLHWLAQWPVRCHMRDLQCCVRRHVHWACKSLAGVYVVAWVAVFCCFLVAWVAASQLNTAKRRSRPAACMRSQRLLLSGPPNLWVVVVSRLAVTLCRCCKCCTDQAHDLCTTKMTMLSCCPCGIRPCRSSTQVLRAAGLVRCTTQSPVSLKMHPCHPTTATSQVLCTVEVYTLLCTCMTTVLAYISSQSSKLFLLGTGS